MHVLQETYDYPVDIEYTINLDGNNDFVVNLLQCRPLQTGKGNQAVSLPKLENESKSLFHLKDSAMGRSREEQIDVVVYIDPYFYYTYPYQKKMEIAKLVGKINQYYSNSGKHMLLITPGRIGTSSPELGVPVSFAEISEFHAICEVAYSKAGYLPELSYDSHMFQDLVESDILYAAILENDKTLAYNPDYLQEHYDNCFLMICPSEAKLENMIQVYELTDCMLYHDFEREETLCVFA